MEPRLDNGLSAAKKDLKSQADKAKKFGWPQFTVQCNKWLAAELGRWARYDLEHGQFLHTEQGDTASLTFTTKDSKPVRKTRGDK